MNKWDLSNPFVYSYLKKALLGYYNLKGTILDEKVVETLWPYFDFEPQALYARGAATIFPFSEELIKNILKLDFLYLSEFQVSSILETYGLSNKICNSDIKLGLSLLGSEVLKRNYAIGPVTNYFLPNLAKAYLANE